MFPKAGKVPVNPVIDLIIQHCQTKPHLTPDVILVDGNGQWHGD